jgi:hypothetical protein
MAHSGFATCLLCFASSLPGTASSITYFFTDCSNTIFFGKPCMSQHAIYLPPPLFL